MAVVRIYSYYNLLHDNGKHIDYRGRPGRSKSFFRLYNTSKYARALQREKNIPSTNKHG
jgi:hypothetical protein